MKRFPEGSRVRIRVDPKDQRGAMIVGDSTWPIYWPLGAALILVWLAYGWAWFWPARDDRRRRRRPKKDA